MSPISEKEVIEQLRRSWSERPSDGGSGDPLAAPPVRSLSEALSEDSLALIVEPKRATAVRGVINPNLDIAQVARECAGAGATAISIVTESTLSHGSIEDLRVARAACSLPLVARDYVVHVGRVRELRAAGADALLFPVVAFLDEDDLDEEQDLHHIVDSAHRLGMDVVLSVRSEQELAIALETDCEIVNIDNRDDDGRIDVERTFELLSGVPVGKTVISESVAKAEEVASLHRAGVDALLLDEGHVDGDLAGALAVFNDLTLD